MAKSLDELVNFLVDEIALDGDRGKKRLSSFEVGCRPKHRKFDPTEWLSRFATAHLP